MNLSEFTWDKWNVQHISRHQVNPEEVEEAFERGVFSRRTKKKVLRGGVHKRRYISIGQTFSGRFLRIIWETRERKIYTLTALDADAADKRLFKKRRQ